MENSAKKPASPLAPDPSSKIFDSGHHEQNFPGFAQQPYSRDKAVKKGGPKSFPFCLNKSPSQA